MLGYPGEYIFPEKYVKKYLQVRSSTVVKLVENIVALYIHPGSLAFLNTELNSTFENARLPR